MSERFGESLGNGLGVSEIGELVLQFTALLPSESGAEKRERFSGTGRGLEERMTAVLSLGSFSVEMTRPMNTSCDPYGWYGNSTWMPPMWYTFLGLLMFRSGPGGVGVAETISVCVVL